VESSLKNETEAMSIVSLFYGKLVKNETKSTSIVSLLCGKLVKK
jgi:hypothetical protein